MQLISIPLKQGDNLEKLRRKILRVIQKNERGNLQGSNIKTIEGIDPSTVKTIVTNSQYIVFLLNDGRVCRMACKSHSQLKDHHISHEMSRQARDTSLQVMSDAEYARQLQAQFNSEAPSRQERFLDRNSGTSDISPYVSLSYTPSLNSNFSYSPSSPPVYVPQLYRLDSNSAAKEGAGASNGASGQATGANGGTQDKKLKKDKEGVWPDMGPIEWLIVKQVCNYSLVCLWFILSYLVELVFYMRPRVIVLCIV